jgi:quinolinate synthase
MEAVRSIDPGIDLEQEIRRLKIEKNAVLLSHFYQESEIQDVADFVGDSLDLARTAQNTTADIILFAGVRFMAETAKILNPSRKVLIPDMAAGCSLEDSAPPEMFRAWREAHPDSVSITYINCSARVKALSDIICTSSNAERIVRSIPEDREILFAPDRHLGAWLEKKTGRKLVLWPGTCIVHEQFSERELVRLKTLHPRARVAAHPECPEAVLRHADHVGSTKSILQFVSTSDAPEFIIGTEAGIIHQMEKAAPGKTFFPLPTDTCACNLCPYMKKNTIEKVYLALRDERPELTLPEDVRQGAERALQRMLELS